MRKHMRAVAAALILVAISAGNSLAQGVGGNDPFSVAPPRRHKATRSVPKVRAEKHLAALKPHLSTLKVVVPDEVASLPGLVVRRNGIAIGAAAFGVAAPVDPGTYRITVAARGHEPTVVSVVVGADADHQTVQVERPRRPTRASNRQTALQPQVQTDRRARHPTQAPDSTLRSWGYGVGAVGAVALTVGLYYGLRAITAASTARELCPQSPCSDREGTNASTRADRAAWIADIALGAGVVGLGAGGYLLFVHPATATAESEASSLVQRRFGGAAVTARGAF